jgi:UDP-N-acetylglucosamine acyltransferase
MIESPPRIHPTAIVSSDAVLAADVEVGPYAIIEGPVVLGAGCIVRGHAQILGRVVMGERNDIGPGCVIGDRPQHRAYAGEETGVVIGRDNVFREHVTVHRGMPNARVDTIIGDGNLFMVGSHVAHDCTVGHFCNFANAAVIGGHVRVGDGVFLSGHSAVHQNCRIGRLAMVGGVSVATQDVPPFWIIRNTNVVVGVNVIGMRRAGIAPAAIAAVREAFKIIYFDQMLVRDAAKAMESRFSHIPAVMEIVEFIRDSKRGVPGAHRYRAEEMAAA